MDEKQYSIGELAELSGATVRTIQYYDQIGLLVAKRNEANLRYYTQSDLMLFQQILFYKRLDFPLKEIKQHVANVKNREDLNQVLEQQKTVLFQKEMELKMNQTIVEVVQTFLKGDEGHDLEPLMKLVLGLEKQNIMAYASVEYSDDTYQAMEEGQIQLDDVLALYWGWKEVILEASALKLSDAVVESTPGYQIGKKWAEFIGGTGGGDSELSMVAELGLEHNDQWPEEDLFLYNYSKDYIDKCYAYYLREGGESND